MRFLASKNTAFLVTNPYNIYYLTGIYPQNNRDIYILITLKKTYVFANILIYPSLVKNFKSIDEKLIEVSQNNPLLKTVNNILLKDEINYLEFESNNLTFSEYQNFSTKLKGITLLPTQQKVENLRINKSEKEIAMIKTACDITNQCLNNIVKLLEIGVTEKFIAQKISFYFQDKGIGMAFSPVVAFNKNTCFPHHQPSSYALQPGSNLILIDMGAKYKGYCADMTRMIFLGKPNTLQHKVVNTLVDIQKRMIQMLKLGQKKADILDKTAKEHLASRNYPSYPHGLGHGIGLEVHELPNLNITKPTLLKPKQVFSLEPAIYLSNQFGARIEDVVYLKSERKVEILTSKPQVYYI